MQASVSAALSDQTCMNERRLPTPRRCLAIDDRRSAACYWAAPKGRSVMAVRSIASLSLTFGLVSIPVKVYLATESSAAIKFKLMAASGSRLRQQYVADPTPVQTSPLFAQTLNETEDENENENESDKEIEDRSET